MALSSPLRQPGAPSSLRAFQSAASVNSSFRSHGCKCRPRSPPSLLHTQHPHTHQPPTHLLVPALASRSRRRQPSPQRPRRAAAAPALTPARQGGGWRWELGLGRGDAAFLLGTCPPQAHRQCRLSNAFEKRRCIVVELVLEATPAGKERTGGGGGAVCTGGCCSLTEGCVETLHFKAALPCQVSPPPAHLGPHAALPSQAHSTARHGTAASHERSWTQHEASIGPPSIAHPP